jgi:predicted protein tyrosine phosphatase
MIVEIMSRANMGTFSLQEHRERIAVVSISDVNKESPVVSNNPKNGIFDQLRLHFDDVDIGSPNCISDEIAVRIVEYIKNVQNKADKIIVHCEAGISRSAGVGAAIMKYLNDNDWPVFDKPRYRPNMTCYRTVLNAFYDSDIVNV